MSSATSATRGGATDVAKREPGSQLAQRPQVFDPFADLGGLMLAPLGGDFFGLGSQLGLPSTQALMSKAAQNLPPLLKVDVIEDKDKYSVLADCPGATRDQVSVELEGDVLHIAINKKSESDIEETKEGGWRVHRIERATTAQNRSIKLAENCDFSRLSANVANGVLRVDIPKLPGGVETRRKIAVS